MHIKKRPVPPPAPPPSPPPPTTSLYKPPQFLSRPLSRRWTALSLRWTAFLLRLADSAICARVASSKLLYPTAKNKVLRVVSSHFGEVWQFIRQKIKFGESADVPEVVDFWQQRANKSKWT